MGRAVIHPSDRVIMMRAKEIMTPKQARRWCLWAASLALRQDPTPPGHDDRDPCTDTREVSPHPCFLPGAHLDQSGTTGRRPLGVIAPQFWQPVNIRQGGEVAQYQRPGPDPSPAQPTTHGGFQSYAAAQRAKGGVPHLEHAQTAVP